MRNLPHHESEHLFQNKYEFLHLRFLLHKLKQDSIGTKEFVLKCMTWK